MLRAIIRLINYELNEIFKKKSHMGKQGRCANSVVPSWHGTPQSGVSSVRLLVIGPSVIHELQHCLSALKGSSSAKGAFQVSLTVPRLDD